MPKMVADLFKRKSLGDQTLGARVPKGMGTAVLCFNLGVCCAPVDDVVEAVDGKGPNRRFECQEYLAMETSLSHRFEIPDECMANKRSKGIE